MEMVKFSDRLSEYMAEYKINQAELAKRLDYSPQAVSKWMRDKSTPSTSDYPKIAHKLGISTAWLAGYPDTSMKNGANDKMDKEFDEIIKSAIPEKQIYDKAKKVRDELLGSTRALYTVEQLDTRLTLAARAFDSFLEGRMSEETFNHFLDTIR